MDVRVDIPPREQVVVSREDGDRYHRVSTFPGREAACDVQFDAASRTLPRAAAEDRGFEPCARNLCFGANCD